MNADQTPTTPIMLYGVPFAVALIASVVSWVREMGRAGKAQISSPASASGDGPTARILAILLAIFFFAEIALVAMAISEDASSMAMLAIVAGVLVLLTAGLLHVRTERSKRQPPAPGLSAAGRAAGRGSSSSPAAETIPLRSVGAPRPSIALVGSIPGEEISTDDVDDADPSLGGPITDVDDQGLQSVQITFGDGEDDIPIPNTQESEF